MPSEKILEQKKVIVEGLADKMSRAASGVLVKYEGKIGFQVKELFMDEQALRERVENVCVIKNTLIGKAADKAGFEGLKSELSGMNALAISYDDPIAPAKILKEYAEKIETFEIRGGILDGAVVDAATVNELADIPPKEVLVAKLLGSIQSPLYKFAYVLQAIIDKENEGSEEAPAAEEAPAETPAE